MNKIPLKQAIASGSWFECHAKRYDEQLHFRLRVLAFEKASVEEIDPSLVDTVTIEGVLWLLSVAVVSLNKTPTDAHKVRDASKLIDEDGFEFGSFYPDNSWNLGVDEKTSALRRFSEWSGTLPLSPKIKARGAIAFVLPDEENNYYFGLNAGNIREA